MCLHIFIYRKNLHLFWDKGKKHCKIYYIKSIIIVAIKFTVEIMHVGARGNKELARSNQLSWTLID
jgi:hypothetical protein